MARLTEIGTVVLFCALTVFKVEGFQHAVPRAFGSTGACRQNLVKPGAVENTAVLHMSNNDKKTEYSREIYLRTEAESPFRKVRFFIYFALGIDAFVSLLISSARIAAALSGVNTDLLDESLTNAAVDITGLVVLFFLNRRDQEAQESQLKRASKGAELAKLRILGKKSMLDPIAAQGSSKEAGEAQQTFTTSLASMRRGRGIEKRVVIVAAGSEKIDGVLREAQALEEALDVNDLLVVPVVMPQGVAPSDVVLKDDSLPASVAFPLGGEWKAAMREEAEEAASQGVDIEKEGFCVILKKNGRVGQRTKGIFLPKMVGQVEERRELGLDVKNI